MGKKTRDTERQQLAERWFAPMIHPLDCRIPNFTKGLMPHEATLLEHLERPVEMMEKRRVNECIAHIMDYENSVAGQQAYMGTAKTEGNDFVLLDGDATGTQD